MQIIKIDINSTLPIIIKIINDNLEKAVKSWKVKSSRLDVKELTVFIKVKIDNLNASSLSIPEIVNNKDKIDNDNIKIITEKKYL